MREVYYIKRDAIDVDTFHLYSATSPSNQKAKYHISAIHRDFMRDLLVENDPDFRESIMSMDGIMMAKIRINIEEVDFV